MISVFRLFYTIKLQESDYKMREVEESCYPLTKNSKHYNMVYKLVFFDKIEKTIL